MTFRINCFFTLPGTDVTLTGLKFPRSSFLPLLKTRAMLAFLQSSGTSSILHDLSWMIMVQQSLLLAPSALMGASHWGPWICVCWVCLGNLWPDLPWQRRNFPSPRFSFLQGLGFWRSLSKKQRRCSVTLPSLCPLVTRACTSFSSRPTFTYFAIDIFNEAFLVLFDFPWILESLVETVHWLKGSSVLLSAFSFYWKKGCQTIVLSILRRFSSWQVILCFLLKQSNCMRDSLVKDSLECEGKRWEKTLIRQEVA